MLKIKKNKIEKSNINNKNTKNLNVVEDTKKLMDLENSYKNYLILLDIIQKKIEEKTFKKYEIEKNNNEATYNVLMKKKFLNNPFQIFSIIK